MKKRFRCKWFFMLMSLLLLVTTLGALNINAAPKTITFWHYWKDMEGKALEDIVAAFNKTHKDLQVKTLSTGDYDTHHTKLLTAISGGNPPDVSVMSSDYLPEWVSNGAVLSLEKYIKGSKYDLKDMYSISLKLCSIKGKIYALPLCQDTYALLYNKDLFKKAGLDPEKPPQTIEDLDAMAAKLTVKDTNGKLTQMGFIPDSAWSHFPLYGWAFGGSFYDAKNNKITGNDPNIVKALEWEASYYKKYGLKELNTFKSGLGQYGTSSYAFYTGQLAMIVEGEWQPNFIKLYAPKDFNWGVTPFPAPKDKPEFKGQTMTNASAFVIPAGSKNEKAAWEFIKWIEQPKYAGEFCRQIYNVPPFKSLANDSKYVTDPRFGTFLKLLDNPKLQTWPQIAVANKYNTLIGTAEEAVLVAGNKTAKQALDELTKTLQDELDKTK